MGCFDEIIKSTSILSLNGFWQRIYGMDLKIVGLGGFGLWVLLQNNCVMWVHNAYMRIYVCIGCASAV